MRGFRTNRAILNSKSSHFGNNQTPTTKFKVIQGGLAGQNGQADVKKVNLPDWMKAPKSLIDSQKAGSPKAKKSFMRLVTDNERTQKPKSKVRSKTGVKSSSKTGVKSRIKKAA